MVINIVVADKRATLTGAPVIVCGNSDYSVNFTFDEEWNAAVVKTARFVYVQDGAVKYEDVVFQGNTVAVPVLFNTREVCVGVFAENLRTTTPAKIPCDYSIRCGTAAPADPTPSQYDQIVALLDPDRTEVPTVLYTPQTLTPEQQAQVRENIGVGEPDLPAVSYEPQNLTENQKAQARKNIGAIGPENAITKNLLKDVEWRLGYYAIDGKKITDPSACTWYTGYCDSVPVNPGDTFTVRYTIPINMVGNKWFALNLFGTNGSWHSRNNTLLTTYEEVDNKAVYSAEYTVPDGVFALSVSARSFARGIATPSASASDADVAILADMVFVGTEGTMDGLLLPDIAKKDEGKVPMVVDGAWVKRNPEAIYANLNVKVINHRGYNSIAPENTLSAYRLSKKKGFTYAECDIRMTSDKVPVLLHDNSVDRTSNGTGAIGDLTFDYVRSLDFGSWKSADYAGEQIPTFEEFILLCKRIGLHPYIHIDGNATAEDCAALVATVKRNGMYKKVTWIAYSASLLRSIKAADEYARLGLVADTLTDNIITTAVALKGDKNEVFVDVGGTGLTADGCALCATSGVPLEVWGEDDPSKIATLDPYVSGFTTDTTRANVTLYDRFGD